MRNPTHLEAWVNPHTISLYLETSYLERIEDGTAHLIAPTDYAEKGARACQAEIQEALRIVGLAIEAVSVSTAG